MTDIFVKIEKNGEQVRLPKSIQDAKDIYLMGYSFFDTTYNITNFGLTQGANSISIPDGNYDFSELVFALEQALIDITADQHAGTIVFNEGATLQNEDTALLLNSDTLSIASGYNTGILGLSLGRIFHIDIDEIRSTSINSMGGISYSILANHKDAFGLIAKQDIIHPQSAECSSNLLSTITPHIKSGDGQDLVINKGYPAHLWLRACQGKSQKLNSTILGI